MKLPASLRRAGWDFTHVEIAA